TLSLRTSPALLDRVRAGFAGTDADNLLDIEDENLAVADAAGARGLLNRLDRGLEPGIRHHDFDFHLGQKIHDIFGAPVKLGMALLAAETLGLGHRDALHADFLQRFFHFIELERFDDGFNLFHATLGAPVRLLRRGFNEVAGLVPDFFAAFAWVFADL